MIQNRNKYHTSLKAAAAKLLQGNLVKKNLLIVTIVYAYLNASVSNYKEMLVKKEKRLHMTDLICNNL